jgi:hypothetical protein
MEMRTLRCLNKYFFKEKENKNNILERDTLKYIYIAENKDREPLF